MTRILDTLRFHSRFLLGGRGLAALTCAALSLIALPARAQYVGREQDIADVRLGQRILVDDGTCPSGQVKEVSGAKMTANGVARAIKCVPRSGPKKR